MKGVTKEQEAYLERMQGLLKTRMATDRHRLNHSLGVARTARKLARTYGVDPFLATAAGLIHDWDKVVPADELVARAVSYHLELGDGPSKMLSLLHGPVAARELPELFPELDQSVFQAVARHTSAATDMTPLDMVVYIADGIEPMRTGKEIEQTRKMVGEASLEELFFNCLAQSIAFVIKKRKYLYPGSLTVYNAYAERLQR